LRRADTQAQPLYETVVTFHVYTIVSSMHASTVKMHYSVTESRVWSRLSLAIRSHLTSVGIPGNC